MIGVWYYAANGVGLKEFGASYFWFWQQQKKLNIDWFLVELKIEDPIVWNDCMLYDTMRLSEETGKFYTNSDSILKHMTIFESIVF